MNKKNGTIDLEQRARENAARSRKDKEVKKVDGYRCDSINKSKKRGVK